jgi:hypothetical protein
MIVVVWRAGVTWAGSQQGNQALNTACCLEHLLLLQSLHHLHECLMSALCCSDAFRSNLDVWSATRVSKKSTDNFTLPAITTFKCITKSRPQDKIIHHSKCCAHLWTMTTKTSHAWRYGISARQSF